VASCDKEYGNKNHDGLDTLCLVRKHKWDIDFHYINGDPIYDKESESLIIEEMDVHLSFQSTL